MIKIYTNAGHSDKDSGAVGYETERRLNVAVTQHMNDYLLANYECEVKTSSGSVDSLTAIANEANAWGADLFVSNHFNAGGGDGYENFVYSEKTVPLGKVFEKHVLAIGQNSRGVKVRPSLAVLRLTHMPAILNEGAFVDNKKDIADWNDDAELQRIGIAYAKAAAEHLGLKAKKQKPAAKSVEAIAKEVIAGKWGNGAERVQKLTAAGYDADAVQAAVNAQLTGTKKPATATKSIDTLAREVIAGKWGNGATRTNKLLAAGYDPNAVQKRVNELLK